VKKGLKGAMISVSPDAEKQYDNPVYDPFWAAAQEYTIPLSLHLATGKQNIVTTSRSPYALYMGILRETACIQDKKLVWVPGHVRSSRCAQEVANG